MTKIIWNLKESEYIDLSDSKNLKYANKKYRFELNGSKREFFRGDKVEITLQTENVVPGTTIPYSIKSSCKKGEIFLQSSNGKFKIASMDEDFKGSDTLIFNVSENNPSTRKEIVCLSLDGLDKKIEFVLNFSEKVKLEPEPVVEKVKLEPEPVVKKVKKLKPLKVFTPNKPSVSKNKK